MPWVVHTRDNRVEFLMSTYMRSDRVAFQLIAAR